MINKYGKESYGDDYFTVNLISLSRATAQPLLKKAG